MSSTGESSNAQHVKLLWKEIQRLRISLKVKILVWRACNEGLPTLQQLYQKRIVMERTCELCRSADADKIHALVLCPSIKIFRAKHVHSILKIKEIGCFMSFVTIVKEQVSLEILEIFCMLVWSFQFCQNKWIHEKSCIHVELPIEHALSTYKQFQELQTIPSSQLRLHVKWSLPPSGYHKVNVNGALFFDHNKVGIRIIIWDSMGTTYFSVCIA